MLVMFDYSWHSSGVWIGFISAIAVPHTDEGAEPSTAIVSVECS